MAVEFIKARQMQTYLHLFKHTHTHKHTHYLQALRLCTDVSAVKFRLLLTSITLDQCNKTMGMQFQSEAWGTCTP